MAHWIRLDFPEEQEYVNGVYETTLVIDLEKATHFRVVRSHEKEPPPLGIYIFHGQSRIAISQELHPDAYNQVLQYMNSLTAG